MKLGEAATAQTFMRFAFVAAVGGIGGVDVAVSALQLFQDAGFVDDSRTTIVGKGTEQYTVFAIGGVHVAELLEVLAEKYLGLRVI